MSTDYQTNHRPTTDAYYSDDRSLGQLIKELRDESVALVRQEVALAKAEVSEKVHRIGRGAAWLIAGALLAHLSLVFLLLAATAGLERFYDSLGLWFHGDWIAPLVVGLIIGVMGTVMMLSAKKTLANTSPIPEQTIESLKEDKQWLQAKTQ